MNTIRSLLYYIREVLNIPLFQIGRTAYTIWTLLYLAFLLTLLFYLTSRLRRWMVDKYLVQRNVELGVRQAAGSITRYILVVIGFMAILQTAGIDLSGLTILAGGLGIGVGFGLQYIVNNFVSGLIILFERPVKVGDRVEIGDISGDVIRISWRSTTIVTNNNITIIVPNSEFMTSRVINWSYVNRSVRFNFPVPVPYSADPELVRILLATVVDQHPGVLKEPKPNILLKEFGDNNMTFVLRIWTRDFATRPGVFRSELNYAISKIFRQNNIQTPYPHQELHIRSGSIDVRVKSNGEMNKDGTETGVDIDKNLS